MNKYKIVFIFIALLILPLIANAQDAQFNPDYIISDHELTNFTVMNQEGVINFLKEKAGALANYFTNDLDNQLKHAGEIIYNASQRHKINPQILIALIQKEQTLVTQPAIKPTQFDWATGFACYDYRRPVSRFSGFTTQVDRAAWRLRYFLEHPWEFYYRPGQAYKISGKKVRPQNLATSALYNYTPYLRGNKLFWKIWQSWFAKKGPLPDGTLVRARDEKGVWLIQNGLRRAFHSKAVFLSRYSFGKVREISRQELEKYEIGEPMAFPNYSLLKASAGDVFLTIDNLKRKIVSSKIFRQIGFNPEEVITVDDSDLTQYIEDKPITTPYPTGALLQNKINGAIFYVKDEVKYPIIDKVILENNFPYNRIIQVGPEALEEFIVGEPIKLNDGALIKTRYREIVYVIAQGQRLPIADIETFEGLGYQWDLILTVPEPVLIIHPLGQTININQLP